MCNASFLAFSGKVVAVVPNIVNRGLNILFSLMLLSFSRSLTEGFALLETMQETKKDLTVEALWDFKEFLTSLSQKDKTANDKNMHDQLKRSKKEKRSNYCWCCLFRSSQTFLWLPGTR